MVTYFYSNAGRRVDDRRAQLVADLKAAGVSGLGPQDAVDLAHEVGDQYVQSRGRNAGSARMLQTLRDRFNLAKNASSMFAYLTNQFARLAASAPPQSSGG
jgi:hypothetical protein